MWRIVFRYDYMPPLRRTLHAIAPAALRGRLLCVRRWRRALCATLLLGASLAAHALTQDEVIAGSQLLYAGRIAALENANALDVDAGFGARVHRIADRLIIQAKRDYPDTAAWPWEVHTTIDADQNADCMAGGMMLVSRAYVERLELNDAELAMLLAHEIEHATLRHNLKEYEQAMRLDPRWSQRPFVELEDAVDNDAALVARLASFDFAQEVEADREGLLLAWRAGWPPLRLANYFKKMARLSGRPNSDSDTHPSPASRWSAARTMATALATQTPPK